jgi:hypothetical protein
VNLSERDRRALTILGVALVASLAYLYWPESDATVEVAGNQSVEQLQDRLARFRTIAASAPAKEAILKTVGTQLAAREKGLLQADTAAQAQAQVIQMMRSIASSEAVPVDIRSTEIGAVAPYGDYGAVTIAVQMDCRVEQLVNLLAAIAARPEMVSPGDLRVTSSSPKEKTMGVRLTLTALVPRKLLPVKKATP